VTWQPLETATLPIRHRGPRRSGGIRCKAGLHAQPPVVAAEAVPPALHEVRRRWAELLRRIFEVDPLRCPHCGQEMRIVAFITVPAVIDRILAHLRRTATARRRAGRRPGPPRRKRVAARLQPWVRGLLGYAKVGAGPRWGGSRPRTRWRPPPRPRDPGASTGSTLHLSLPAPSLAFTQPYFGREFLFRRWRRSGRSCPRVRLSVRSSRRSKPNRVCQIAAPPSGRRQERVRRVRRIAWQYVGFWGDAQSERSARERRRRR